jgi:hypothetical protein
MPYRRPCVPQPVNHQRYPRVVPKEKRLTIGIGVLCSTQPRPYAPRPNAIVMMSDTMGSTDTDSTDDLHKMLIDSDLKVFAVCANRLERCGDLWPLIQSELKSKNNRSHGQTMDALNRAVHGHRANHFRYDILNTHFSLIDGVLTGSEEKILEAWERYDPGVEMIVGTFDSAGMALLYKISFEYGADGKRAGWVSMYEYPGTASIGTGSYNAMVWLNYRRQHLSLNIKQSAYHTFEAMKMASSAPTVNENVEMLIATVEESSHFSKDSDLSAQQISLSELMKLTKRYGPRDTDALGFPKHQEAR